MPKYGICNLQTLLLEYQAYPRSKKISTLFNDWENIAFGEESEKSEALANKFGLLQIQLGGLGGGVTTPGKVRNVSPCLRLETIFPAVKLTQICSINMNIAFS